MGCQATIYLDTFKGGRPDQYGWNVARTSGVRSVFFAACMLQSQNQRCVGCNPIWKCLRSRNEQGQAGGGTGDGTGRGAASRLRNRDLGPVIVVEVLDSQMLADLHGKIERCFKNLPLVSDIHLILLISNWLTCRTGSNSHLPHIPVHILVCIPVHIPVCTPVLIPVRIPVPIPLDTPPFSRHYKYVFHKHIPIFLEYNKEDWDVFVKDIFIVSVETKGVKKNRDWDMGWDTDWDTDWARRELENKFIEILPE
ncbi:hypothetical protein E1B28_003643 [Marasmius oreades]|uniref:Uncharacterized protein n=1 Tax=Marasmius oreades TaxID=181124 RepID=A0A9P8ABF6_9AGAR|nr:uncharacterized protein E1B28_003643 [Marasmius oreades]KAG7096193.1 hypothetical protein E1B28_003643 [Marasmius oreades]